MATMKSPAQKIAEHDIVQTALRWWEAKKPCGWTFAQHRTCPTVNCVGHQEHDLATMCGEYYKVLSRKRDGSHHG